VPGLKPEHVALLQGWVSDAECGALTDPKTWKVSYQATKHGWDHASFCRNADGKPRILYLIVEKAKGWLFGAYTSKGIPRPRPVETWIDDRRAFVFTLTNPHGVMPFKTMAQNTLAHFTHAAPMVMHVGAGGRIRIHENSNTTVGSSSSQSATYPDPTGNGPILFTGARHFLCADIFAISTA
jgi:hypothetical protein